MLRLALMSPKKFTRRACCCIFRQVSYEIFSAMMDREQLQPRRRSMHLALAGLHCTPNWYCSVEPHHLLPSQRLGQKAVCLCTRQLHCTRKKAGIPTEESDLLMKAVEAASEYAQSLTEIKIHSVGRARLDKENQNR